MSQELRTIRGAQLRADKPASGSLVVRGRAASYNVHTVIGKGMRGAFREVIAPNAFKAAVQRGDDCRLTLNHSSDQVYGRVKAGNLTLREDAQGLAFTCTLNDSTMARDLHANVMAGLFDQCSFAFQTDEESWLDGEDAPCDENDPTDECGEEASKLPLRVLRSVRLFDVSIVDRPAYSGTTAAANQVEDLSAHSAVASIEARSRAEQLTEQRAKKAPCKKPRFATDAERVAALERITAELNAEQVRRLREVEKSLRDDAAGADLAEVRAQIAQQHQRDLDEAFAADVKRTRLNARRLRHPSETFATCQEMLVWLKEFLG